MTTSIGKLSKSFLVKILVGIIILPFVFWGMGDVFRGGNQNVIASIDSKKISTQEFMKYLNRLKLSQDEIKSLPKTNLVEKILSEYIGRKVMALEIKQSGITVNDNSLRDIIKNDKLFFKDKKFSRTEYEKFLLKSGVTAPAFEKNIVEQESRRQLLGFLGGGISIPYPLVEKAYKKDNQIKTVKFLDLKNYYSKKKHSKEKINELYEKNKNIFIREYKTIQYSEITPEAISGTKEYDQAFFKKLDLIENNILDGQSYEDAIKENSLKTILINGIDKNKLFKDKKKADLPSDEFFKKIFSIKEINMPEIIKDKNKYFLVEIKLIQKDNRSIEDPDVLEAINLQLNFETKIKGNTSLIEEISKGKFDKLKLSNFAKENNLLIKDYKISNLKQNDIFSEEIIKRIFEIKDGEVNLITDGQFNKNFLVLSIKTDFKKLDKNSNEFEKYEAKARLNLVNEIYKTFDESLNKKYNVELNQRTIDRVKNSF